MEEQLQTIVEAIKDYGAAIISTISVGGVAAVGAIIIKVKSAIDKTKESMNALIAKKDEESQAMQDNYKALTTKIDTLVEENYNKDKKIDELVASIEKIEK